MPTYLDRKFAILGVLLITAFAWYVVSPFLNPLHRDDPRPTGSIIASGTFTSGLVTTVRGEAMLLNTSRGRILRFENFYSTSAPNVHVRLAFDLQSSDTYDLGPIQATSGNVNYMLPAGLDIRRYRYVLIWSEPFRLLLGSAELK